MNTHDIESDRKRGKPQHIDPELKAAIEDAATTRSPVAITKDGRGVMLNYGDEEDRMAEHEDNACAYCGGSGHKDDVADRKRRGEPVGYIMPTALKQLKTGGNAIVGGVSQGCDVPIYIAPQPAEQDKATEPMKKKDWNVELSSWSDEDFVQVFHERPDLTDRLRRVLAEPSKGETVLYTSQRALDLASRSDAVISAGLTRVPQMSWNVPLYTAPQPAEPCASSVSDKTACGSENGDCDSQPAEPVKVPSDSAIMFEWSQTPNTGDMRVDLVAFARALLARYGQPDEPVKRKRRYAQGTALGEFGIIPMCDQVNDEPVKVQT